MKLLTGILMLSSLAAAPVAAQTDPTTPPTAAKALLKLMGVGVQIYTCKDQPGGPAWTFVAPDAKLFDNASEAGTHGAGPTWTLKDGSWVKGQMIATRPSPDADAIPWLLLKTASTSASGVLTNVTYIRRSDTSGGKAQATGCDATHLGVTDRVQYKATYTFYAAAQ
jgi:Protein of unknown function (DUF3455)